MGVPGGPRGASMVCVWSLLAVIASAAAAEDPYAVSEEPGVSLRALLDVRVAQGSKAPS